MVGYVSTALGGTTGAISLGTTPTVSVNGAVVAGLATASVVGGAEAGTLFNVVATIAGVATTLANHGASAVAGQVNAIAQAPFIVPAGAITITTSIATMTGAIDWYLYYVPFVDGGYVGAGTN
jgi:hypothetical protein